MNWEKKQMKYEFIEPLQERPKVKKKIRYKSTIAEKILNEFKESDAKYAKVSFEKLKGIYKSPAFTSRALGRVAKRLGLKEKITIYSDENNIYLEKL
ncbi:hypothetical protein DRO35_04015 [Candidatus Bathyarchaeota archaeon]|nr:MAG: hypothetical protein DRO35_04015 [Candidatus Bathyarchaeota archaeon]